MSTFAPKIWFILPLDGREGDKGQKASLNEISSSLTIIWTLGPSHTCKQTHAAHSGWQRASVMYNFKSICPWNMASYYGCARGLRGLNIEAAFQLNRASIHPWTGACVPPNLIRSATKRTQASSDIMLSPPLQRMQSSTTFIKRGTPTPLH